MGISFHLINPSGRAVSVNEADMISLATCQNLDGFHLAEGRSFDFSFLQQEAEKIQKAQGSQGAIAGLMSAYITLSKESDENKVKAVENEPVENEPVESKVSTKVK